MTQKKKIILSSVISLGMLMFSYWVGNLSFPLPISGEKTLIATYEMVHNYLWPLQNERNDVLAINVSHNKQLVYNGTQANAVTDRKKLLELLSYLKQKDDYRYIMLDIGFSKDDTTDVDSAVFDAICNMGRIVIFRNANESLPNKYLYQKSGLARYYATPTESDFVKFPYLESQPLKMYEDFTNRSIRRYGPVYHDGWYLARNSIILKFHFLPDFYNNLGDYLQEIKDSLLLAKENKEPKDKYILIGAFDDEDQHSTYLPYDMPGVAINFNAFLALMNGHHHISLGLGVLLFCIFFAFGYLILSQRELQISMASMHLSNRKWLRVTQRILILVCSWIGFTMVLSVFCIVTYVYLDEVYDILATSTLFGIFNVMVKLYNIVAYED